MSFFSANVVNSAAGVVAAGLDGDQPALTRLGRDLVFPFVGHAL